MLHPIEVSAPLPPTAKTMEPKEVPLSAATHNSSSVSAILALRVLRWQPVGRHRFAEACPPHRHQHQRSFSINSAGPSPPHL